MGLFNDKFVNVVSNRIESFSDEELLRLKKIVQTESNKRYTRYKELNK